MFAVGKIASRRLLRSTTGVFALSGSSSTPYASFATSSRTSARDHDHAMRDANKEVKEGFAESEPEPKTKPVTPENVKLNESLARIKAEEAKALEQASEVETTPRIEPIDAVNDRRLADAGPLQFDIAAFPSLLHKPHPLLDQFLSYEIPKTQETPYGGEIQFHNTPTPFHPASVVPGTIDLQLGKGSPEAALKFLASVSQYSVQELRGLQRHLLEMRRVVHQSKNGRQASFSASVVVGNGKGMVGYGDGKAKKAMGAARKAFHAAVQSMDYVQRSENRTIPYMVQNKWSAAEITLRPRPPGFGLQCPPVINAIARCAGIKDLSGAQRRSSSPLSVAKATLNALWGGSAPGGLSSGVKGKRIRREDMGKGVKSIQELEMARGRRLRPLH